MSKLNVVKRKRLKLTNMAIGIDISKRKPRQVAGTPSARARNILGVGILGVGVICGLLYHYFGATTKLRKAVERFYEDPIEEVERKQLIAAGLPNKTGDHIRKMLKEEERPDLPYK